MNDKNNKEQTRIMRICFSTLKVNSKIIYFELNFIEKKMAESIDF